MGKRCFGIARNIDISSMMNRVSLVIDSRTIHNSGIGVYLRAILPQILMSGRFHVCLLGRQNVLKKALCLNEAQGVTFIECSSDVYSLREQFEVPAKVPQCDIFWSPHYNVPILPVRAMKRVVTIHDVYHLAYIKTLHFIQKVYARIVLPLAASLSDRIITVSSFSKSEIVRYTGADPEKIEVIHNGVDYHKLQAAEEDKKPLPSGRYVLSVGNVKAHKNITGLIKAFALFHKSSPEVNLMIVGKKDDFITGVPGIDNLVSSLGIDRHVTFTGFVEDNVLRGMYKKASVFVFPSFYEGFGLPPLEAMASGVPVVASRSASIPEVCGDAALYVDPYDAEDIARGIARVFSDDILRNELVSKGLNRVQYFPWQESGARHIRLFEELHGR